MLERITKLPSQGLVLMVRGYQLILSPHLPSSCNFTPTCSGYAIEALRKYGALKGSVLAAHRILRCHPWGGHGFDPPVWYSERSKHQAAPDHASVSHPLGEESQK